MEAVGRAQDREHSDQRLMEIQSNLTDGSGSPGGKGVNHMKMLTIVCREEFDDFVLLVFIDLGVKGYTMMSGASGSGETGAVSGRRGWTDRNTLFMVTLEDAQMAALVSAMKGFRARLTEEQHGVEVPLKAFLQPCEVIL